MKRLLSALLAFTLFLCGCTRLAGNTDESSLQTQINRQDKPVENNSVSKAQGNLSVHYIDVGQADCILLMQGDNSMLIDGGNNDDGEAVVKYLQSQGISKVDYIIATHPHEDHIGGIDNVINSFEIGQVIMPKVSHNTKTYEDILKSIKNKGLTVTAAKAGQSYWLGQAKVDIISPLKDKYDDLNAYSVVARVVFGENSFLFTGDMITQNETALLKAGTDVSANVLKVAHHGSYTSNSQDFLKAVGAKYSVIQVGKDNDYGHPHTNILRRLTASSEVYRTDRNGNIIVTSNGKDIEVKTER